APGVTSQFVNVPIIGDTNSEPDEIFSVDLSSPVDAAISDGHAAGTIQNDDNTISINSVSQLEGNSGTTSYVFTVNLTGGATTFPVTVQYATADGTATAGTDYTAIPLSTLTFPAGVMSKTVTVLASGDTANEPDETFSLRLSNSTNATIAAATGTGTLKN